MAQSSDRFHRVMVYARICPKRHGTGCNDTAAAVVPSCLSDVNDCSLALKRGDSYPERRYTFDAVFGETSSQANIFSKAAVPLIDDVLSGFNGTILAYGQTGTGKTHTMAGPALAGLLDGSPTVGLDTQHEGPVAGLDTAAMAADTAGIIPRAIMRLFESASGSDAEGGGTARDKDKEAITSTQVSVAAVQLYCESVQDLLALSDPGSNVTPSGGLAIREDPETGVYIEGATWVQVSTPEAALRVIATAARNRATASTLMNAHSSRSHAIVMLRVERRRVQPPTTSAGGTAVARVTKSSLFLVDLAGSERVGKSGVLQGNGDRFDEARAINLSLSALGNCIAALAARSKGLASSSSSATSSAGSSKGSGKGGGLAALGQVHVPYRDSKLTRLLQDSLGGNARTALIITVTPHPSSSSETSSTLEFGARAAQVAVHARKNETLDYKALYQALKSQLESPAQSVQASLELQGRQQIEQLEVHIDTLKQQVAALEGENASLRGRLSAALELAKPTSDVRPPSASHDGSPMISNSSGGGGGGGGGGTPNGGCAAQAQEQVAVQATSDALSIVQGILSTIASSGASPSSLSAPLLQLKAVLQSQGSSLAKLTLVHSAAITSMQSKHRAELSKVSQERDSARESLSLVQQDLLASLSSLRSLQSGQAERDKEVQHMKGRLTDSLDELAQARNDKEQAIARAEAAEAEAETLRDRLRGGGRGVVQVDGSAVVGGRSWTEIAALYESSLRSLQARVSALEAHAAAQSSRNEELAYALRVLAIQREQEEEEQAAERVRQAEERRLASLTLHVRPEDDILVVPTKHSSPDDASPALAGSIVLARRPSSGKTPSTQSAATGASIGTGAAKASAPPQTSLTVTTADLPSLSAPASLAAQSTTSNGKPPTPTATARTGAVGAALIRPSGGATVAPSSAVTSAQLAMKNAQLLGLSSSGSFRAGSGLAGLGTGSGMGPTLTSKTPSAGPAVKSAK